MKKIIKDLLFKFGYTLGRKKLFFDFNLNQIDLVFDVGAHNGEFVSKIRKDGYLGKIISFEPQKKIYNDLKVKVLKSKNWILHERCALGEKNTISKINIYSESQCSSILQANRKLFLLNNNLKKIKIEKVKMFTLDYLLKNYYKLTKNSYLKIDAQGYEKFIFMGTKKNIKNFKFIQIESGLYNLYKNEKTYEYFFKLLKKFRFTVYDIKPFAYDTDGKLIQFDLIFKNNSILN